MVIFSNLSGLSRVNAAAKMDTNHILLSFGFHTPLESFPESIHPYAPVFRVEDERGAWIVKRGRKPFELALAVAAWTEALAAGGIPVVTPARGCGENPRSFRDETGEEAVWVVYPYIAGRSYQGSLVEIRAAGDLLGRLHAFQPEHSFGLKVSRTVVEIDPEEVEGDISRILGHVERFFPSEFDEAEAILEERTSRYFGSALPRLLSQELPLANCTWDYKASNLVFREAGFPSENPLILPGTLPVLVDPDNAGRIPRLYDLAIAALLFHNDGVGPGRLFNRSEWETFLEGYLQHVQLSPEEREAWDDLLLCAWVDEGLWLLNGSEEDWASPVQGRMQLSLLLTGLDTLRLA
jgi:spectinomycin phosphotransferase